MKKNRTAAALLSALLIFSLAACSSGPAPLETTPTDTRPSETAALSQETEILGSIPEEEVPLAGAPALSTVLSPMASGVKTKSTANAVIDYSNTSDGYVMVCWKGGGDPKLKVQVKGPSGTTYTYNLRTDGDYDTFPLSDGNGGYTVTVYKNVEGTSYSTVTSVQFTAALTDEFAPFLRPNQYVNFTAGSAAVAKGAELCAGLTDNLEKVQAVYNFVVENITYDKVKAATVQSGYLPDVDAVLESKTGICFDYAALMAAMLRSQEVPVKLVVGYTGSVYHAWLNVWSQESGWIDGVIYFDGNQWKLMDPTFASSGKQSESIMAYIGNGANYTAKYLY